MKKFKLTKAILTFVLVVSVISSIAVPKFGGQSNNGGISTCGGTDDWGWMVETR
jgi:hypothetical protein